jgi:hypothetical protein
MNTSIADAPYFNSVFRQSNATGGIREQEEKFSSTFLIYLSANSCTSLAMHIVKQVESCPCGQLIKHCAMKTYGRVNIQINVFLTSALVGDQWSASCPSRFGPRKRTAPYPLDRTLDGPQTVFRRCGEVIIFISIGTRTPTTSSA